MSGFDRRWGATRVFVAVLAERLVDLSTDERLRRLLTLERRGQVIRADVVAVDRDDRSLGGNAALGDAKSGRQRRAHPGPSDDQPADDRVRSEPGLASSQHAQVAGFDPGPHRT